MKSEDIRVMICLSGSPSNQKVIRSAARFARSNHTSLTALFVDNGKNHGSGDILQANMDLARKAGAAVEVIRHRNVLAAITEYAQDLSITDLFIGYSGPSGRTGIRHLATYRLVHNLPDIDIHIIPDAAVSLRPSELEGGERRRLNLKDFFILCTIMAAATCLSFMFDRSVFSNSNIITIYILAVLITSVMTAERIYGIIAAILYILLFNFLFIDPRFSFLVYDPDYMVTYFVSIIAAVITGNVSSRVKQISLQERINAYQAQILLNASEQLQRAGSAAEIAQITVKQLNQLLNRQVCFYPVESGHLSGRSPESAGDLSGVPDLSGESRAAVDWTVAHNHRSGWGTAHFPDEPFQYMAVRTGSAVYGVVGVSQGARDYTRFEENILLSMLGQCALSLESEKNRKEREAVQIVAENERLRSNLLRSISHDLRTPLTSIYGNSANLLEHGQEFTPSEIAAIYSDLHEDAAWLIELVENLLAITKLEGNVRIHPVPEVVADVLETAVHNAGRHKDTHSITLIPDDLCLVALMDVPLILQVINNLLSNAIKHTPAGTSITVRDWKENQRVFISVADDGPGISDEEKSKIFDLFYTGKETGSDSSRSLGLGLNLCRTILEAHGQTIRVQNHIPCGAEFIFSLQLAEEKPHETNPDPDY